MVQSKITNTFCSNVRPLMIFDRDMLNEIISVTNPTVDILLFGNTALNDEANSFIFRSVQKFILRSKRFKTKQSQNNED